MIDLLKPSCLLAASPKNFKGSQSKKRGRKRKKYEIPHAEDPENERVIFPRNKRIHTSGTSR